jgi:hypothetical protein
MFKSFRVLLLSATFALSACSSIPLGSLYKLSRIDFMTTDLSRFRLALTLPNTLKPQQGGVHMDLAYKQGEKPEEKRVVKLEESKYAPDFVGLPTSPPGTKTYVYRLPQNEVITLNKIRNDAIIAKAKNQKGYLRMGIAPKEFCAESAVPKQPLLVTTYVLSSENGEYVVLTRDIDLRSDATISASLDQLAPCSNER